MGENLIPTQLLVVRHGITDWNRERRLQGWTDMALNETGRQQAADTAVLLQGIKIDAVYASDLARAADTASIITGIIGGAPELDPRLRERDMGDFEGRLMDEVIASFPNVSKPFSLFTHEVPVPAGEQIQVFYERCIGAAQQLAQKHAGGTLLLVCHGGVVNCMLNRVYHPDGDILAQYPIVGNAAITRFQLETTNDTCHWRLEE